jgi:hypothetical protein
MVLTVTEYRGGSTSRARVCILGEPGVGKTRLAGTFPDPLFIDVEGGAASARQGVTNAVVVPTDRDTNRNVESILKRIAACPVEDGVVQFSLRSGDTVYPVQTVVIDSLDAIQQAIKQSSILQGKVKMQLSDWDVMLNLFHPIVNAWHAVPCHVVAISHTRRVDGEGNKPGIMGFALQGSLRTQLAAWFDYILHLTAGGDSRRYIVLDPGIQKGYKYTAKDRHGRLASIADNSKWIDITGKEGYPDSRVADTICGGAE